jgi:very-short-patch-repair endonuclease
MGACLWADGIVYGQCAAAAWEVEGGRWRPPEVAAPRHMKRRSCEVIARRITSLGPRDVTKIGALPVTSPVRTIIDLAASVHETKVEIAFEQLLRRGLLTPRGLLQRLDELGPARLPGTGVIRDIAESRLGVGTMTESELETLVRRWLRKYGFPDPVFQHWVTLPDYGPARLDCAYPELKIGIEADSYTWHSGRRSFERDRARNSELASFGWIIIQTTQAEIQRRPERAANRLKRARVQRLGNRGPYES